MNEKMDDKKTMGSSLNRDIEMKTQQENETKTHSRRYYINWKCIYNMLVFSGVHKCNSNAKWKYFIHERESAQFLTKRLMENSVLCITN